MGLLLYNQAHSFQMEAVTFCYILHEVFHVCEELDGIWSLLSMRSKFITWSKELAIDNILIVS